MSYAINAGIEVSVGHDISDNPTTDPAQMVWYNLTDDNRQPVKLGYEVIEKTNRMADGTLRRYVIARKYKITSSWQNAWSNTAANSDGNKGMSWLRSFYEANVFIPIYVRVTAASVNTQNIATTPGFVPTETVANVYKYNSADTYIPSIVANQSANMVYNVFITSFDYEVIKRNKNFDLVNVNIEFTEI